MINLPETMFFYLLGLGSYVLGIRDVTNVRYCLKSLNNLWVNSQVRLAVFFKRVADLNPVHVIESLLHGPC